MCGIVGYLGPQDPKAVIVGGLRRLEYRGYDSAGVAILDQGKFRVVRAPGKLGELDRKLKDEKFSGHLGIGHTRWATHGVPNETNAHPHSVDGVSLVHNGIIENETQLRIDLKKAGAVFSSETDSEIVAHLIANKIRETNDLFKAVELVLPMLEGAYSIVVVWDRQPDVMVAFKNGPPLVVGLGKDETFIASDIQAMIAHTNRVCYLNDLEMVVVRGRQVDFFSAAGARIEKQVQTVHWTAADAEKAGYKHFMLKEIHEQPRAVAAALAPHIQLSTKTVSLSGLSWAKGTSASDGDRLSLHRLREVERIFIVACGTSYYAGMTGKYVIEQIARLPVEVDIASEFRYRDPVIPSNSLVVVISQSGETADTLAALRHAKSAKAMTVAIVNVEGSSIDREAEGHLYMNAGPEVGVASTKAFVATLSVLNLLALQLGKIRGRLSAEDEGRYVDALLAAPSQMETVLAYDKFFSEASSSLKAYRGILFMGRGVNYPLALEGALKVKELAYMHAEGYAAGEMKHGPLALIDERMMIVMVMPADRHYEKSLSNLEEARARGGHLIAIGTGDNTRLREVTDHYISLPKVDWIVNPIIAAIPLQLLAYHVADAMGHDVDQPRNLAKSVTVE